MNDGRFDRVNADRQAKSMRKRMIERERSEALQKIGEAKDIDEIKAVLSGLINWIIK